MEPLPLRPFNQNHLLECKWVPTWTLKSVRQISILNTVDLSLHLPKPGSVSDAQRALPSETLHPVAVVPKAAAQSAGANATRRKDLSSMTKEEKTIHKKRLAAQRAKAMRARKAAAKKQAEEQNDKEQST